MISTSTMRQYDEYLQEQQRVYRDAQYDRAKLNQLVSQIRTGVGALWYWVAPGSRQNDQMQSELSDALHAGLSRGVGRC